MDDFFVVACWGFDADRVLLQKTDPADLLHTYMVWRLMGTYRRV